MKAPEELIDTYLEGKLSEPEVRQLTRWIQASPENARAFAEIASVHSHLRDHLRGQTSDTKAKEQGWFRQWLDRIAAGDEQAIGELWNRYFPQLVQVAERRMPPGVRRVEDGDDVALSALHSFFCAVQEGRFPELDSPDGLWRLLFRITARKAASRIRKAVALKAGGGNVRGDSVFGSDNRGFDLTPDGAVGPEFQHIMDEQCEELFAELPDSQLREIAQDKLDGRTNKEIAQRQGVALRTIERRLERIRAIWQEFGS